MQGVKRSGILTAVTTRRSSTPNTPLASAPPDGHLLVRNLEEAETLAFTYPAVISVGPWPEEVAFGHANHHVETFRDILDPTHDHPPLPEHLERMLAFAQANPGPLLVHCRKGKRRSTATAWGILINHGHDPVLAFERLKAAQPVQDGHRREFRPNRLMVAYLEDIFALTGLVEYAYAHEDKYPNERDDWVPDHDWW